MTSISVYLDTLNRRYQNGISREHTYRGDLQTLLMQLLPDILVTNEPARISCGAPDYLLTRKDVPVGYIEAKDIGVDLGSKLLKEQFDRYKAGLSNLIFTDYLDFYFYKDGAFTISIAIAEIKAGKIIPLPENFDRFQSLIHNFAQTISQTIKSPTKLAEMMAGKAKLMADVIEKSLQADDQAEKRSALKSQMLSFQQMLIHDINNSAFADIYAQTIAYGMFAARYHDPTLPTFSRQEAATLIPRSNPFLRRLFQDIAGYDLDDRLVWIVDELVSIFLATDVADIMRNFGKSTKQEDPVVHFYETFLAAYNPALRKSRGVWYTPQPVVNFIVRAVDDILKTEFNLPQGLADTSKTKIKLKVPTHDKRFAAGLREYEQEVHKVQILDPATGTGTFLAEVVRHIYKKFEGQQGIWSNYVNQHLIPRLNGFELLMASYAMAHLKMDMLLTETGYKATTDQRFRIFLTNSLEESHADTGTLFSSWLSDEADQANAVKRDTPVMVVMGNPPYSVSSSNKSPWIEKLTADYKKDLNERNIQPLSDDYIKFIRFGQHFIDKNGEGVLAYISNNSFIDGLIHRQMRKHLLESFDKIYILDLHGNAKKKEVSLSGGLDQNVFDIMAGVSINLFIKTGKKDKKQLGELFYNELLGKREFKYNELNNSNLESVSWTKLQPSPTNYFFVNKNFDDIANYEQGFKLDSLFLKVSNGFTTERDAVTIHFDKKSLDSTIADLIEMDAEAFRSKYDLLKDGRDWTIQTAKNDILTNERYYTTVLYRPFDFRYSCYTGKTKGFYAFPRGEIMNNFLNNNNFGLILPRQTKETLGAFVTNKIAGHKSYSAYDKSSVFPLYVYSNAKKQNTLLSDSYRTPNLNLEIVNKIADGIEDLEYHPDTLTDYEGILEGFPLNFGPLDLLDYIYAYLNSPSYREKYKEFLKIDFPRIPYPKDRYKFWRLAWKGCHLRKMHLLESSNLEKYITQYPIDGNNKVIKTRYDGTKVWINETQYFDSVPQIAWEFYIGGYQPAQKWLKDRKERELTFEDILDYQKIIVALTETDSLMKEIDEIISE
jgi:predicted helicase